ncbi:hypothetical protein DFJ77DRAFT_456082 [Powellomyces hirtus]|nr:hypothetical protein DFJ77DRAFT_456082 [Powellomyces hirtus]
MGTWSTDTSSMQYRAEPDDSAAAIPMNLISTQLPRTIPGLSALHTPTHTHASPTPAVASAKSSTVHTPRTKSYVHKACVSCKTSHVACDVTRPCQRCVRSGKASSCIDAERKKRGRPTSSTAVVQKPSLSLSPEPATHPVKTASRPKKRSRHANSDAPALSAFTPAITAEIGAQLQRLQAGMNESDGFIVTDEMVQAVTALSTLLPTQDAAGQQQMNYNDQDVKVEPEDETQDSAMEAATAATALLAGLRDFNPDIMMEFYENFSGFGEQSQCMFGDPTLLPPQIVTANDLMGGTTNM